MALTLGDNFSYQGAKPLDARLTYSTVAAMKAVADATMYNGCMAYCTETDKTYQWKSTNTVDETLGKWREFQAGGGGTTYEAGDGIDIINDEISTEKSQEGWLQEVIDQYPASGELVSIVNAFNRGDLYSTDEKMIGQWIDGKPLYAKTIQATIPTAQGTPTDISIGASVDTVVDANTMFATGNGGFIQTPVINGALSGSVRLSVYNNSYTVASLQNKFRLEQLSGTAVMGGSSCYVTLQYTKTTDSAIAIGSENEYSTTEKIVGTWIDGKPIYQKTFTGTSGANGADATFGSISNAETIVSLRGIVRNSNNMMHGAPNPGIYLKYYNGNIQTYTSDAQFGNQPCSITVQYTKTSS